MLSTITPLSIQSVLVSSCFFIAIVFIFFIVKDNRLLRRRRKENEEKLSKDIKQLKEALQEARLTNVNKDETLVLVSEEIKLLIEERNKVTLRRVRFTDGYLLYINYLKETVDTFDLVEKESLDKWNEETKQLKDIVMIELESGSIELHAENRMTHPIIKILNQYIGKINEFHSLRVKFICESENEGVLKKEHLRGLLAIIRHACLNGAKTVTIYEGHIEITSVADVILERIRALVIAYGLRSEFGNMIKIGLEYESEIVDLNYI